MDGVRAKSHHCMAVCNSHGCLKKAIRRLVSSARLYRRFASIEILTAKAVYEECGSLYLKLGEEAYYFMQMVKRLFEGKCGLSDGCYRTHYRGITCWFAISSLNRARAPPKPPQYMLDVSLWVPDYSADTPQFNERFLNPSRPMPF